MHLLFPQAMGPEQTVSILKACMNEAHEASRWSRWSLIDSLELMITPNTLILVTLSAPLTIGSLGPRALDLLLKTISSLVLDALS